MPRQRALPSDGASWRSIEYFGDPITVYFAEHAMPVRIPTYRSRTAWVTGLATVIAALVGAAWTRMILRRVPSSTGDFEGLHLER